MAKTTRAHLPGDITFSDPAVAGMVLAAHGALKSWEVIIDNTTMTSIRDFAEYGDYETITGEKMTLNTEIEAPSLEIQAVLTGSDIIAEGYIGHFSEIVGPAVAGVLPALTDIPLLANSEVVRKSSTADGKTITDRLTDAAVPVAGQYIIVDATGVISVEAAYILYAVVNYAKYDAAAGEMLVTNRAATVDPMNIVIIEKAWEPVLSEKGSEVLLIEGCEIIKKPGWQGSMESPNIASPSFNIAGTLRKSAYTS